MWNPFKKSKVQQTDAEYQDITEYAARVNAEFIYKQIYSLFNERINELKEGDNFILLLEESIKICDIKKLNKELYDPNIYMCNRIPELHIVADIEMITNRNIYYKKYYVFTIKISHDDVSEIYDIKFKVHPSPKEINNYNEICVTVYSVDKNIYKLIKTK